MKERLGIFVIAALFTCGAAFIFQHASIHARPNPLRDSGLAGQHAKADDKMKSNVSLSDHDFVMKVAKNGMAEVELANLALTKAGSDDVKKFAQRMIDDHTKANNELTQLAQSKSFPLPTDSDVKMDADFKQLNDKLSGLSGAEFDREYMHHMVMNHQKGVGLFKRQAKSKTGDDNLENWAEKTLPTLKAHLRLAVDTAKKVGASIPATIDSDSK